MDFSSESSADSVIYTSSDGEVSVEWNSEWSTDTEEMVRRVETQVTACPIPIAEIKMTTASDEPGPSTSLSGQPVSPKFSDAYVDEILCYASSKGSSKRRIE